MTSLLVGQLVCALAASWVGDAPRPSFAGNTPAVLAMRRPRAAGARYRVAVLGDVQGSDVGTSLVRRLAGHDPDFLILTGDVIRSGKTGYHALASRWLAGFADLGLPIHWVLGNRDMKPGTFELEDFEGRYGPTNFWFSHGGDLFVGLRVGDPFWDWGPAYRFAEEVLSRERDRHRRVFLFSHVPPAVVPILEFRNQGRGMLDPVTEAWVGLCRRFRVDYFVSAHHHGYLRRQAGDTTFLVSGGGGGTFHGGDVGSFHHGVLLEVGPEGVTETLVVGEDGLELDNALLGVAVAEVWPRLAARGPVVLAVDLLLLGLLVWAWGRRARTRVLGCPP